MPFGLTSAPAIFQAIMNRLVKPFFEGTLLLYSLMTHI